uniref:Uncharacterized protein n=1 Tax=Rhizophora mucronata TaxID=61149 RepID=A0A2P2PHB9_RHIMU
MDTRYFSQKPRPPLPFNIFSQF